MQKPGTLDKHYHGLNVVATAAFLNNSSELLFLSLVRGIHFYCFCSPSSQNKGIQLKNQ